MVFVVIQRRHKVPTLLFLLLRQFHFSLIIQKKKQKKHSHNQNHKKTFSQQTLIQKSSDPLFSFLS